MIVLWIISLGLLMAYILRMLSYMLGWRRVAGEYYRKEAGTGTICPGPACPGVSVVIPVRDEETGIRLLLEDLASQDYPIEAFEVIIVDDHSTDRTRDVVRSFLDRHPNIRLLSAGPGESGKKDALDRGIKAANHPLILNTDGDCRVPARWLAGMIAPFSDSGPRMRVGTVIFEPDRGFFPSMQSLEYFSLSAVSAGSAGLKDPILCSAANLAYYRKDYLEFVEKQAKESESGDDIFLLLWLKKKYPGSVRYSVSPDSAVRTKPAGNMTSFAMQRMRWTSKSRYYRDFHMISTALLVFGLNLLMLVLLLVFLLGPMLQARQDLIMLMGILFLGKSLTDLLFLSPVLGFYGKIRLLWFFLPMEIVYFMYVSLIGVTGQFFPFSWKGRKIRVIKQVKTLGKGK